jgi:hypothetical protein
MLLISDVPDSAAARAYRRSGIRSQVTRKNQLPAFLVEGRKAFEGFNEL